MQGDEGSAGGDGDVAGGLRPELGGIVRGGERHTGERVGRSREPAAGVVVDLEEEVAGRVEQDCVAVGAGRVREERVPQEGEGGKGRVDTGALREGVRQAAPLLVPRVDDGNAVKPVQLGHHGAHRGCLRFVRAPSATTYSSERPCRAASST